MKKMVLFLLGGLVMTSCVSNKKFRAVQEQLKTTEDLLNTATIKLNSCLKDKELLQSKNVGQKQRRTHDQPWQHDHAYSKRS